MPEFEMRPEKAGHKVASLLLTGYQDIDFENAPGFSKHYLLREKDETAVRSFLCPDPLHYFSQHKGWSVRAGGEWLLIYRHGKTVKGQDFRGYVNQIQEIANRLLT